MITLTFIATLVVAIMMAWRPLVDLGSYLWEDRNDPPSC
jgi:hypothetical protein